MFMLTRLTPAHLPLFLELKKDNPGQWKLGSLFDEIFPPADFYIYRLCDPYTYTVGYIENNKLISMSSMLEAEGTSSWVWLYYCNIKVNYNNLINTHAPEVMSEMFQESFRRKLSTCYMMVRGNSPSIYSDAKGRMKDKIEEWHEYVPEFKKFHWVDEERIKSGEQSKNANVRWMAADRAWPIELRLRQGTLKQEFREEILFSDYK
jgi:hypothetical protein